MPSFQISSSFKRGAAGLRASRRMVGLAVLGLTLPVVALAQTPDRSSRNKPFGDTVTWTVSVPAGEAVKPGGRVKIAVQCAVLDGWHVYSQDQLPRGPIPLSVSVEQNDIAIADGAVATTAPIKAHDQSFGFETQYYAKDFTLTVPVKVDTKLAPGPQQIPVSVQFQTCNGKICQPPKTVHLSAQINVKAR